MPRIPTYNRSRGITSQAPAQQERFVDTGGALQQAAGTVFNEAGQLGAQLQQMKLQDDINTVNDAVLTAEKAFQTEIIDYKSTLGKDAFGGQKRLLEFTNKLKSQYAVGDSRVAKEISNRIDKSMVNYMGTYGEHEARQRQVVSKSARDSALDFALENSYRGIGTLDKNQNDFSDLIAAQAMSNQISDEEAERLIVEGKRKIASTTLAGMISRNPDTVKEQIDAGLWDSKLDRVSLDHYRNEAIREGENQKKLQLANQKAAMIEAQTNANKELTDSILNEDVNGMKTLLGKYRDVLPADDYNKWVKEYQKTIDNAEKVAKDPLGNEALIELQSQAMSGEGIASQAELAAFKEKVSKYVSEKEFSAAEGRKVISDAEKNLKDENNLRNKQVSDAVSRLKTFKKVKLFGKDEIEQAVGLGTAISGLRTFMEKNPDADPIVDYVEPLLNTLDTYRRLFRRDVPRPEKVKEFVDEAALTDEDTKQELEKIISEIDWGF